MKTERSPVNMADIRLNRCPAQTLMCCVSMATIESIQLTLKLNEINRLQKPNLTNTFHQINDFAFIDQAFMRTINGLNRHWNAPFHQSAFCWNEVMSPSLTTVTAKSKRMQRGCGPVSATAAEGCAVEAPLAVAKRWTAVLGLQIRNHQRLPGLP